MKHRRIRILTAAVMAIMALAVGCSGEGNVAPSPNPSAMTTPGESPIAEATPMIQATPGATGDIGEPPIAGGVIEGFVEGAVVEAEKLSDKVKDAIKKEYAEATIKGATYATYENQQMYKIQLENAEDKTTQEVYVTADGVLIPAKATASASPQASASPESSPKSK